MVRGIRFVNGDLGVGVGGGTLGEPRGRNVGMAANMGVIFGMGVGVGVPRIEALIAATRVAATFTVGSSLTCGFGVPIVVAKGARVGVGGSIGVAVFIDPMTQAVENKTEASPNTITGRRDTRASKLTLFSK